MRLLINDADQQVKLLQRRIYRLEQELEEINEQIGLQRQRKTDLENLLIAWERNVEQATGSKP